MARGDACGRAMAAVAVRVANLVKSFAGRPAVRGVSLTIHKGEIVAFLGPNGSGKTTTMRMIAGLLRPDGGTGEVLGVAISEAFWAVRAKIGYMAQHFALYGDLTVRENLLFAARVYGLSDPARVVEEAIARFGLSSYADVLAGGLSGGWKQRLQLAAALQHRPGLLLLDEPTSGVDPDSRRFVWEKVQEEAAHGAAALVSTHYLDEAEQYADRIVYILHGRIVVDGSVEDARRASGLFSLLVRGATRADWLRARERGLAPYLAWTAEGLVLAGEDAAALRRAAEAIAAGRPIEPIPPRLEEVFLHLSRRREAA